MGAVLVPLQKLVADISVPLLARLTYLNIWGPIALLGVRRYPLTMPVCSGNYPNWYTVNTLIQASYYILQKALFLLLQKYTDESTLLLVWSD